MRRRAIITGALVGLVAPSLGWAVTAAADPIAADTADTAVNVRYGPERSGSLEDVAFAPPLDRVWEVDLDGEVGAPLIADGRVAIPVGDGDAGSRLHVLDAAAGHELLPPRDLGSGPVAQMAFESGRLFVPRHAGDVLALDLATGREIWSTLLDDPVHRRPSGVLAVDGGVHVVSNGYGQPRSTHLDQASGRILWEQEYDEGTAWTPSLAGDHLIVPAGCATARAFAPADGSPTWTSRAPCSGGAGQLAAVADGRVFVPDWSGGRMLDVTTGEQLGQFTSDGDVAVRDGTVFAVVDGDLEARSVEGELRWSNEELDLASVEPDLLGSHLYAVTAGGDLVAVTAADGVEAWRTPLSMAVGEPVAALPQITTDGRTLLVAATGRVTAFRAVGDGGAAPRTASPTVPAPELETAPSAALATAFRIDPARTGRAHVEDLGTPLRERWRVHLEGEVSYPLITADRVVVTSEGEAGNAVHAFDRRTGARLWRRGLPTGPNPFVNAAYHDGSIVVVDDRGVVTTLDEGSGAVRWTVDLPALAGETGATRFRTPPAVHEGVLYAVAQGRGGVMFAYDLAARRLLWSHRIFSGGTGFAIHGDAVVYDEGCQTQRLDRRDGRVVWRSGGRNCTAGHPDPTIHRRSVLSLPDGFRPNQQRDLDDGSLQRWSSSTGHVAVDGDLSVALAGTALQATDTRDDRVVWRVAPGERLVAAPVIAGGTVYTASEDGTVYAVDGGTGEVRWTGDAGGPVRPTDGSHGHASSTTGLGVANDTLVVPAGDQLVAYTGATRPPPRAEVPVARDLGPACPTSALAGTAFTDVDPSGPHGVAIRCASWWQLARGRTTSEFAPSAPTTRGQMATFIANLIERSGRSLPDVAPGRFSDVGADSPHARNVERLAAAGVVQGRTATRYAPNAPVTRAQMASFLVRAHDLRTDRRLPAARTTFGDIDPRDVHADNIGRAGGVGIVAGRSAQSYTPADHVTRAQMATFLARTLALLVEEGHTPPRR
jgi:outer membrane protein assembly factor BamB